MPTQTQIKNLFASLPRPIQLEIGRKNSKRARRVDRLMNSDTPIEGVMEAVQKLWTEVKWPEESAGVISLPVSVLQPRKQTDHAAILDEIPPPPAPAAPSTDTSEGARRARQAVAEYLQLVGKDRLSEVDVPRLTEDIVSATWDIAGGRRRWSPNRAIEWLVEQQMLPGDPQEIAQRTIKWGAGSRLRHIRTARGMSRQALTTAAAAAGCREGLDYWSGVEEGRLNLWGDRVTAAAMALAVPEEYLLTDGPPLDAIPPVTPAETPQPPDAAPVGPQAEDDAPPARDDAAEVILAADTVFGPLPDDPQAIARMTRRLAEWIEERMAVPDLTGEVQRITQLAERQKAIIADQRATITRLEEMLSE